jgi:hypothetical protein
MTYDGPADATSPAARTGGLPLLPAGAKWPTCAECEGPLLFLAHIPLADGPALEIFMCDNDSGLCDSWVPDGGANAVLVAEGELVPLPAPADGETQLAEVSAIRLSHSDDEYGDALPDREVLGQLAGEPGWIQDDETPHCPDCGEEMEFAVQLEQGHDHVTEINFGGGGSGYAFLCRPCERGTFLYQC